MKKLSNAILISCILLALIIASVLLSIWKSRNQKIDNIIAPPNPSVSQVPEYTSDNYTSNTDNITRKPKVIQVENDGNLPSNTIDLLVLNEAGEPISGALVNVSYILPPLLVQEQLFRNISTSNEGICSIKVTEHNKYNSYPQVQTKGYYDITVKSRRHVTTSIQIPHPMPSHRRIIVTLKEGIELKGHIRGYDQYDTDLLHINMLCDEYFDEATINYAEGTFTVNVIPNSLIYLSVSHDYKRYSAQHIELLDHLNDAIIILNPNLKSQYSIISIIHGDNFSNNDVLIATLTDLDSTSENSPGTIVQKHRITYRNNFLYTKLRNIHMYLTPLKHNDSNKYDYATHELTVLPGDIKQLQYSPSKGGSIYGKINTPIKSTALLDAITVDCVKSDSPIKHTYSTSLTNKEEFKVQGIDPGLYNVHVYVNPDCYVNLSDSSQIFGDEFFYVHVEANSTVFKEIAMEISNAGVVRHEIVLNDNTAFDGLIPEVTINPSMPKDNAYSIVTSNMLTYVFYNLQPGLRNFYIKGIDIKPENVSINVIPGKLTVIKTALDKQ